MLGPCRALRVPVRRRLTSAKPRFRTPRLGASRPPRSRPPRSSRRSSRAGRACRTRPSPSWRSSSLAWWWAPHGAGASRGISEPGAWVQAVLERAGR